MKHWLLLLAFVSQIAYGAEADIKGFRLGMSVEAVKSLAEGLDCEAREGELTECYHSVQLERQNIPHLNSIAEQQANSWHFEFMNGRLDRITVRFEQDAFKAIVAALTAKHGRAPDISRRALQNRMGARLQSQVIIWPRKGATLYALEHFGDMDTSALGLFSNTYEASRRRRDAGDSKRRAKDL